MAERLPHELWVNIFNHLTPVDLCFSISPVNKLFFEISQDNQIWNKFKCDSWNDKSISLLPTIKRKYAVSEPSLQTLYKNLYIHWIREEGIKASAKNDCPEWVIAGKQKLDLLLAANIAYQTSPLEPLIQNYIKNKPLAPSADNLNSNNDFNDVISKGVLLPFSNNTKTITLKKYQKSFSARVQPVIARVKSNRAHGIFWCIFSFTKSDEKAIEIIKERFTKTSPHLNHLMILDYSPIGSSQISTADKERIKELGAEYVEPKDIGTALEKMIKILEKDYFKIFPKYLPTLSEFQRFVFQPTKLNELNLQA